MSARDAILGRIRRSLGVAGAAPERRARVADRLVRAPRGVTPARGDLSPPQQVELFIDMADRSQAKVVVVPPATAPGAVVEFLSAHGLPLQLRMGADPRLASIPWANAAIALRYGAASPHDLAAASHADAAIAETGTLVLTSGPDNPTSLNFLPSVHVIFVDPADIVGDAETAIARLGQRFGKGRAPRTINFITGPSRSGDIEQTLILGAHGPRSVLVVVLTPAA